MSIYVLRSNNLVKIGFSDHLPKRVRNIMSAIPTPVEFVGWMPGPRELETHLHERFAEFRFSGEWFVETDEMRTVFTTLLNPEIPEVPREEINVKRKGSNEDIEAWSGLVRVRAAGEWPTYSHAGRISALAVALGWNRNRVKDIYYADKRIALRAFEQEELRAWLDGEREAY